MKLSKTYGKVFSIWFGDHYTLIIGDPKTIKDVSNNDNFVNRLKIPTFDLTSNGFKGLFSSNGELWKHNRRLATSTLTKTKLKYIAQKFERQVEILMTRISSIYDSGEVFYPRVLSKNFSLNCVLSLVFSETIAFGGDTGRMGELSKNIDDNFKELATGSPLDYVVILAPLYKAYKKWTGIPFDGIFRFALEMYQEHIDTLDPENPRDALDQMIIESDESQKESIVLITTDLITAGAETSASSIEWFLLYMCNNQVAQEKAHQELLAIVGQGVVDLSHRNSTPYINAAIKEVLRIRPAGALGLPRAAKESVVFNDMVIPKGTQLIINIFGLHHDEDYWDKPSEFRPERFLDNNHSDHYSPYGMGPRNCVGMNLANDELYLACANILLKYKLSSSSGKEINDKEVLGLTITPVDIFGINLELRDLSSI
eukprot:gene14602-17266_t